MSSSFQDFPLSHPNLERVSDVTGIQAQDLMLPSISTALFPPCLSKSLSPKPLQTSHLLAGAALHLPPCPTRRLQTSPSAGADPKSPPRWLPGHRLPFLGGRTGAPLLFLQLSVTAGLSRSCGQICSRTLNMVITLKVCLLLYGVL